jgi:hypothetical protein
VGVVITATRTPPPENNSSSQSASSSLAFSEIAGFESSSFQYDEGVQQSEYQKSTQPQKSNFKSNAYKNLTKPKSTPTENSPQWSKFVFKPEIRPQFNFVTIPLLQPQLITVNYEMPSFKPIAVDAPNTETPEVQNSEASGGYNFDRFIDDLELSNDLYGPLGDGADNILKNRGAYMPRKIIYKVNKSITVRTPFRNFNSSSKVLNKVRIGGRALSILNIFATGYEVLQDVGDGRYYSATARVGVFAAGQLSLRIPYVGIGVSLGIGLWDYKYGDEFYNAVEQKFGN